jgi:hypothetical protein
MSPLGREAFDTDHLTIERWNRFQRQVSLCTDREGLVDAARIAPWTFVRWGCRDIVSMGEP